MRQPAAKSIWKARPALAPTLLKGPAPVTSALLSKKKTITLLPRSASILLSAEIPTPEWTERLGKAPDIYSAGSIIGPQGRPVDSTPSTEVGILYVHTTDYPMHMWPPEAGPRGGTSQSMLYWASARRRTDAAILLTCDHGMHHKTPAGI